MRRTDRMLVNRMLRGDHEAFEEFADRLIPALYRFALGRLDGDRDLTQEVVQNTVCKAIANLGTYRGEAALLTWLGSICRNEIASHYRRKIRWAGEVELDEGAIDCSRARRDPAPVGPEDRLLDLETKELVHLVLDLLPAHYGQALEWKYIDDLSVREIASRLEIGPKATESLLTRARRSFRDHHDELVRSSMRMAARSSEGGPGEESKS